MTDGLPMIRPLRGRCRVLAGLRQPGRLVASGRDRWKGPRARERGSPRARCPWEGGVDQGLGWNRPRVDSVEGAGRARARLAVGRGRGAVVVQAADAWRPATTQHTTRRQPRPSREEPLDRNPLELHVTLAPVRLGRPRPGPHSCACHGSARPTASPARICHGTGRTCHFSSCMA